MPMIFKGGEELITKMRNIGQKVPDHARRVMHEGADKIVERAKLMCPHDTGALEDSIHQESGREGRGRLTIDIVAGEGLDYAVEIHENYESMPNTPGPNTLAKRAAHPDVYIGSHFLTRAVEEQAPRLERMLIEAITEVVESER